MIYKYLYAYKNIGVFIILYHNQCIHLKIFLIKNRLYKNIRSSHEYIFSSSKTIQKGRASSINYENFVLNTSLSCTLVREGEIDK